MRSRRAGAWTAASAVALAGLALAGCAGSYSMPATAITQSGATLHGVVFDAQDATVTYWFRYGRSTSYGTQTTHRSIVVRDRDNHAVSEPVTGLAPGTTYHYELCARDPGSSALCGGDQSFSTKPITALSVTAQPHLTPAFDPTVSDYVTRCAGSPVTLTVAAPDGTEVAIDGRPARSGAFTQTVDLATNRQFTFSTTSSGQTKTFHVRCLPSDFPGWTYKQPGTPSARLYIATPQSAQTPDGDPASQYAVIFDDDGVPVWWYRAGVDAKLLPNGDLGWWSGTAGGTSQPGFEFHGLDGHLIKVWRTSGSSTDLHDFQLLPNGDALMLTNRPRVGTVDLSPHGISDTSATLYDPIIQEISPTGQLVWSWDPADHGIGAADTGTRWWSQMGEVPVGDGRRAYDYAHANSIQQVGGDTIVASFRHLDAVYAIDKTTGDVIWKLGGKAAPQSLTVRNDPEGGYPLGGQHFARVLADGTLTIHDNNTGLNRPPRAVRYRIDAGAKTATWLEQVTDPDVPSSFCCGSASRLGDGSWVMSWGGTPIVSEFGPGGARHFELTFTGNTGGSIAATTSYRVDAVTATTPTLAQLRAGMDAMPAQTVLSAQVHAQAKPTGPLGQALP